MNKTPVLRERVTLQTHASTADAAGQITTVWTTVADVWAKMVPVKASETTKAGRDQQDREYEATIRWRDDVTTAKRLIWRSRNFDIQGIVDETLQRQYLTIKLAELGG